MPHLIYAHRADPFQSVISVAKGDDLTFAFTLTDEDGDSVTSGTISAATLVIRDMPIGNETWASKTQRASVALGAMTVDLPTITVPVNVTKATVDWTTQTEGSRYWAKMSITLGGRLYTISEFEILVTG